MDRLQTLSATGALVALIAAPLHAAPSIGDCIARRTHTVRYVGCDPVCDATGCHWVQHSAPFNPAVHVDGGNIPETYLARYGHELSLNRATAKGKPPSSANCGTPVGERYSEARVYARLATVCPELPLAYVIGGDDRDDLQMAALASGTTFYDTFFPPLANDQPPAPRCGDGIPNGSETCASCPADVGPCAPPPPPPPLPERCNDAGETCMVPPAPCPTLAAVPQDVADTVAALDGWLKKAGVGAAQRARVARVKAWLALVESYKPKVPSTARLDLVLTEGCAP